MLGLNQIDYVGFTHSTNHWLGRIKLYYDFENKLFRDYPMIWLIDSSSDLNLADTSIRSNEHGIDQFH